MTNKNSNSYCIIMAGGVGSRFWPLSRTARPKQFLDILGVGRTLIQQTYDRLSKVIPSENFYVVTSVKYKDLVAEQLPELGPEQILLEPLRRNTAPCIAYASYKIKSINPDATLVVAPSDHVILKEEEFERQVRKGLQFAESQDALLTLGIKPSRPETGYGYIQVKDKLDFNNFDNLYKVKTFTEKPNREMAEIFIDTGEFYWNSGIFIWSLTTVTNAFEKHMSNVAALFEKGLKLYGSSDEAAFIKKTYSECPGISVDYGIMEKADNVFVLTVDIGWSDMGNWGALYEIKNKDSDGNVTSGNHILTYGTSNCVVELANDKIAVIQGLDGFIIAESNDTLLICKREDEQQIKGFVTDVRMKKGDALI